MPLFAGLFCPTEPDAAKSRDNQDDCEWTITLQPHTQNVDTAVAPPPVETLLLGSGQQLAACSLFPDDATQADSSTLPPSAPQVTTHKFTKWSEAVCVFDLTSLKQEQKQEKIFDVALFISEELTTRKME